jgi:hypothetical protein
MNIKYIPIVLCLGLLKIDLFGHEIVVHEAITVSAAEAAKGNSPAYAEFINVASPDLDLVTATKFMVLGSAEEDDNAKQDPVGGNRSYNHFYDPLDATYGKGLTDVPNDRRSSSPVGNNSFVWGSISNCAGINYYGVFYTYLFQNNINTKNIWSWLNARGYEYKFACLISLNKTTKT